MGHEQRLSWAAFLVGLKAEIGVSSTRAFASIRCMNLIRAVALFLLISLFNKVPAEEAHRYLYVATPGIRNYLEYGGHGLLVYDMDDQHKFVKRIPTAGLDEKGQPLNVKGVCASVALKRIYVSTLRTLTAVDLETEKIVWEKAYDGGCDRMAISPDGKTIYLPSLEKDHWHVVDAESGAVIKRLDFASGAHNTIFGPDGKEVYLAGLRNTYLNVAKTDGHTLGTPVGPFGGPIRPFTVNGSQTLCFVNINGLLGFEVGDLKTGKKLHRVEVQGFKLGPVKRHGCPSHGVGMTPDEREIWVTDAANSRMHIYDATVMPPKQKESIELRDQPGWITFSLDGKYAYPSTLDVIDVKTRRILYPLKDENGQPIQSEKIVEIHFEGNKPVKAGDQFAIGRKRST
jgi:DNA-binding beta-propeller fold protein YncE